MSGGSLDYVYGKLDEAVGRIEGDGRPLHRAFASHLKLVVKALHDVEWEYSCDTGKGDADAAIKAVLGERYEAEVMKVITDDLRKAIRQAQDILRESQEGKQTS